MSVLLTLLAVSVVFATGLVCKLRKPQVKGPPAKLSRDMLLATGAPNQCGPVAEFQLLRYLGYAVDLDSIGTIMGWTACAGNITDTPLNHGVLLDALGANYRMHLSDGKIADVSRWIQSDKPVIVLLKLATGFHWVVCFEVTPQGWICSWGDGTARVLPWIEIFKYCSPLTYIVVLQ